MSENSRPSSPSSSSTIPQSTSILDALKMHGFSLTSLVMLLSVIRSLEAVSLVSRSDSRVRARADDSSSPGIIDATDGELEIANKVIAPDGFPRRLVCPFCMCALVRLMSPVLRWLVVPFRVQLSRRKRFVTLSSFVEQSLKDDACDNRAVISQSTSSTT